MVVAGQAFLLSGYVPLSPCPAYLLTVFVLTLWFMPVIPATQEVKIGRITA
jgi:hypothetical protein